MTSLQDALSKIKLKPASQSNTNSNNNSPSPLDSVYNYYDDPNRDYTEVEVRQMKENHFATNMDRLVEALGQQNTLTTAHAPMTVEEARALLCFSKVNSNYKAKVIRQAAVELRERKLKKANDTENEHDNNSNNNYDSTSAEQLAQERHAVSYASLTQKIRNLIEQVGGTQKGCFVKLSCRSPKDVIPTNEQLRTLYNRFLPAAIDMSGGVEDRNARIIALYLACLNAMKVHTAEEALTLLTQSNRIAFDVELDARFPAEFSTHVIVRPWVPIEMACEFRGFVHNNKLTALSQYYSQCYFPQLPRDKTKYLQQILDFFADIQPKIPLSSYVIDFVIIVDSNEDNTSNNDASNSSRRVAVLELNPFNISTGACLFDWEKDEKILKEGPFEFRVRNQPVVDSIRDQLLPEWQHIIFDL